MPTLETGAQAVTTFSPIWTGPEQTLDHSWAGTVNIDQFRWLARADVQACLTRARDELGARHVRAVAMYSPEMRIHARALKDWRDSKAEPQANFLSVDLTLDGLLDLGLKPVYTTCFTPPGFTDRPETCWPDRNPIGMPRDLAAWEHFVSTGLRHHLRRYGRAELRSWLFECWNEPNLSGFFAGTKEEFFRLWSATWRAVKSVDAELAFGGPSTARGEWIAEFLDHAAREQVMPDFLVAHVYNNDSESAPLSPFDGPASHRVKDSPHFAAGVIRGVRRELEARNFTGQVHWNEWGRSWFPHDPRKETALEAAFIAKVMAQVCGAGDQFAFWCLSDIYDQVGFQAAEFDGHYGMMSPRGLRKPSWFAHQLLCRLGRSRAACATASERDAVLATRSGQDEAAIVIALYPEEITAWVERAQVRVTLPAGHRVVRLTRLDSSENNVVATWRALGAPSSPSREEMSRLRAGNHLVAAPAGAVAHEGGDGDGDGDEPTVAVFELERPGVALLETARVS